MDSRIGPIAIILEDEPLIAIYVEDVLVETGIAVAGIFKRCDAALDWLAQNRADLAVLDVKLGEGSCAPVAE